MRERFFVREIRPWFECIVGIALCRMNALNGRASRYRAQRPKYRPFARIAGQAGRCQVNVDIHWYHSARDELRRRARPLSIRPVNKAVRRYWVWVNLIVRLS
jgi:hypothetical protein